MVPCESLIASLLFVPVLSVVREAAATPLARGNKKSAILSPLTWDMSDCAFNRRLYSSFSGKIVRAKDTTQCLSEPDYHSWLTSLNISTDVVNIIFYCSFIVLF
jgi:hypothetical protein